MDPAFADPELNGELSEKAQLLSSFFSLVLKNDEAESAAGITPWKNQLPPLFDEGLEKIPPDEGLNAQLVEPPSKRTGSKNDEPADPSVLQETGLKKSSDMNHPGSFELYAGNAWRSDVKEVLRQRLVAETSVPIRSNGFCGFRLSMNSVPEALGPQLSRFTRKLLSLSQFQSSSTEVFRVVGSVSDLTVFKDPQRTTVETVGSSGWQFAGR